MMCVHSLVIAQTVFNLLSFLNDISHFLHKIHILKNVLNSEENYFKCSLIH